MRRRTHRPGLRHLLGPVWIVLALALVATGTGFAWFVGRILTPTPPPGPVEGIVVLTGGAGRVREAFHLLLAGRAPRLLVSGVGPETHLADLARISGIPDGSLLGRVSLGRRAVSTAGNAHEAARWARAWHLDSLILVTSFYHMPRALADFRRALPQVRLEPVSVPPETSILRWPPKLWRVVIAEYAKWLATEAGITTRLRPPEAALKA
ncbi:MAG: YdcF family protein [Acetobacteraceae bacterium]